MGMKQEVSFEERRVNEGREAGEGKQENYTKMGKSLVEGEDERDSLCRATELVNSAALPAVLHAAVQLQVLDVIAQAGPDAKLSGTEISARLGFPNPEAPAMLDRMLRLLASYSILTCSLSPAPAKTRAYGLSPVAKHFVRDEDGGSLGPLLTMARDKVFVDSWYKLGDAVIEGGIPFYKAHGMEAFEYPATDPKFNAVVNNAMVNTTAIVMRHLLDCYKGFTSDLKTLIDVGGNLGLSINMITSKYPGIRGINFDLPHVVKNAPAYRGVEHVGGDMFESVPKGDAIFMKWILHDWSDAHCLKLLKNCYDATPADGKVIVVDGVLPVLPETNTSSRANSLMDAVVMTQLTGGKERTEEEFLALAKGAGFAGIRLECPVSFLWVMEFYKQI